MFRTEVYKIVVTGQVVFSRIIVGQGIHLIGIHIIYELPGRAGFLLADVVTVFADNIFSAVIHARFNLAVSNQRVIGVF